MEVIATLLFLGVRTNKFLFDSGVWPMDIDSMSYKKLDIFIQGNIKQGLFTKNSTPLTAKATLLKIDFRRVMDYTVDTVDVHSIYEKRSRPATLLTIVNISVAT